MRRILAVLAISTLVAACGGAANDSDPTATTAAQAEPATVAVRVTTFTFEPAMLTIPTGTTVTWTNDDAILHTVTTGTPDEPDGRLDGQMDGKGATFSFTFAEPGTYEYLCSRHRFMRGSVVVE